MLRHRLRTGGEFWKLLNTHDALLSPPRGFTFYVGFGCVVLVSSRSDALFAGWFVRTPVAPFISAATNSYIHNDPRAHLFGYQITLFCLKTHYFGEAGQGERCRR